MTASSTFNVVDVNATALEDCCGVFKETCFVETVGVDMALDVLLFTDTIAVSLAPGYSRLVGR
jgi:hypothetical protein